VKKFFMKKSVLLVIIIVAVIAVSVSRIRAATDYSSNEYWLNYCAENGLEIPADSKYADFQIGTEDIMVMYHEEMNTRFNDYISKMIEGQSIAATTRVPDKNSNPPPVGANSVLPEPVDSKTGIPKACDGKNYSTYCVAANLLSSPTYGYMTYSKVLDCRKYQIFDTKEDALAYSDYVESALSAGTADPAENATPVYQEQKALEISAKLTAINSEKYAAKRALDQTLSAYDELKTAWPMHKQYMEIYKSLIKFRDKMVEIRHQVEQLPAKFIDATTTKCT
jgi:hypothetical protein